MNSVEHTQYEIKKMSPKS